MAFKTRTGTAGMPAAGATIRVYEAGTTNLVSGLVSSDSTASTLTNPFTVPDDHSWGFEPPTSDRVDVYWVEADKYLIQDVNVRDYGPEILGRERYHGVEAIGAYSFNATTKVFEIATVTGWYKGTKFTSAVALTCDLSSTTDRDHASATLTTNTQYYVYFKDATGVLYWSPVAWDLKEKVPVATIYWNGTSGAVVYEAHSHTRDLDWHINAHLTIGARYYNGLALTAPTSGSPTGLTVTGGVIYDEDIAVTLDTADMTSLARLWYQASDGVYTWADITLPYAGTSGAPSYLDTDTYALTAVGATNFANYWVYATSDIDRPLYIIPTQAAASYITSALARAEQPPVLQGVDISPEKKLIYRFIYKGNGDFIEVQDYRKSSSLPAGAVAATSAAAVTFAPAGDVAATSVQAAIEELDSEKQALLVSGTNIKTINSTSLLGSGNISVGGFDYVQTTNPLITTNPTAIGATWINTTTGEIFVCIDATAGANVWRGQLGTEIPGVDYGPGITYAAMVAAGDYDSATDTGYMGEVASTDLISGDALAAAIGLSAGTSFNSTGGWLKFYVGAAAGCNHYVRRGLTSQAYVVYIAKMPFRHTVSWNNIYNAGAVFGTGDNGPYNSGSNVTQNASATISGLVMKVRLYTAAPANPFLGTTWACSDNIGDNSEWNELMYRVHTNSPTCTDPTIGMSSASTTRHGGAQVGNNWATFTDTQVVTSGSGGNGSTTFGQETSSSDSSARSRRGGVGIALFDTASQSLTGTAYGWRPALELTI